MRYRTAGILSTILAGVTAGMFGLPAAVWGVVLPSLKQSVPDPIPGYERILLDAAVFCSSGKWILAVLTPPTILVLFIIAAFTGGSRGRRLATWTPPPMTRPPALWNPIAAACWSLIFTPAFGAFLHAQNADAMGRVNEARANRAWFYISIGFIGLTLVTISVRFIPDGLFDLVGIGLLLGWFFSLGAKQIRYVKETWRDRYERKSWKKPLLIALGCLIAPFVALTVAEKLMLLR